MSGNRHLLLLLLHLLLGRGSPLCRLGDVPAVTTHALTAALSLEKIPFPSFLRLQQVRVSCLSLSFILGSTLNNLRVSPTHWVYPF